MEQVQLEVKRLQQQIEARDREIDGLKSNLAHVQSQLRDESQALVQGKLDLAEAERVRIGLQGEADA